MTIEQAQDAAELLEHRNKIRVIQSKMKADNTLAVYMSNGAMSFPEEAMPYIAEALEKAMSEIEAKISEI